MVAHALPPETLAAPLHRHGREDELSCVPRGTMSVGEGETVSTVGAGEFAVEERGVWHTFWNPGPGPLRAFEFVAPGAFAWYFADAAEILADDDAGDAETRRRLVALHERYGFELDPESVHDLRARHRLGP